MESTAEKTKATYRLENIDCPVCSSDNTRLLGVRGNREYFGADQHAEPHICTNIVGCKNCGFIYTNPMIVGMEHLERAHYDNPNTYQSDKDGNIYRMFERRLRYILSFSPGKKILDIGAGKGEFLNIAKKHGLDVYGIEPSQGFCDYSKKTFTIEVKQGFLSKESFSNRFDIVTMNHVLEHVDRPYELMDIVSSYLDRNGILFIEVPNTNSILLHVADMYFRLKGLKWSSRLSPLHPPYHKYGYSEKPLRFLLNKAGFEVIGVRTFPEADRGGNRKGFTRRLKNILSSLLNLFRKGELIAIVARKKN
jgi:SAM-dependent methyltransferase